MFKRNNEILIACCILVLTIGAVPAKASAVVNSSVSSKDSFLHPDGTLKLDGSLSGPINLQEWDVQMDPIRRAGLQFQKRAYKYFCTSKYCTWSMERTWKFLAR